jgi:hypothetical protein
MEDGRWKMEDGRWKMEDGRGQKTYIARVLVIRNFLIRADGLCLCSSDFNRLTIKGKY